MVHNPEIKRIIALILVSCLAFSLNLKMKVTCFSEMSVDFKCTTQHYILEDRPLEAYNWVTGGGIHVLSYRLTYRYVEYH
jgi:hypothetical protein